MANLESTLMNISAKAWANVATVHMVVPDPDNAKLLSDQFRAILKMSDDALAELRRVA